MPQTIARPDSDVNTGAWTTDAGNSSTLYAQIDETSASDSDYIRSETGPASSLVQVSLSDPSIAAGAGQLDFHAGTTDQGNVFTIVRLLQGSNTLATFYYPESFSSATAFSEVLSTAVIASISDATNLRLQWEAQAPTFDWDASSQQLQSRFGFTRSGSVGGTYVNSAGFIRLAPADTPRFDYDPNSLLLKGLLLEETRSNSFLASQVFSNSAWTKTRASVTASAAVTDPAGSTAAYKLAEDTTATDTHLISQSVTQASVSLTWVFSIYGQAAQRSQIELRAAHTGTPGSNATATYSISSGVVTAAASAVGSFATPFANVVPAGNSWYRCILQFVTSAVVGNITGEVRLATGVVSPSTVYTGDGTSGVYLWGAQMESGNYLSSYIPTASTTGSRGIDNVLPLASTQLGWYDTTQGTLLVEATHGQGIFGGVVAGFYGNAATNKVSEIVDAGSASTVRAIFTGGVSGSSTLADLASTRTENDYRIATAWQTNDMVAYYNTVQIGTDATGTIPNNIDKFYIGTNPSAAPMVGWIRKIRYWPRRLPNAYLQALTEPQPLFDLNFRTGVFDPRISLTRNGNAVYVNSSGLVATASAGVSRFDYDPITGLTRGFQVENIMTNHFIASEVFSNSAWTKTRASVTASAVVSPRGTTAEGYKLAEDTTAANSHLIQQARGTNTSAATNYCQSIYAKAAERSQIELRLFHTGTPTTNVNAIFDLSAGTVAVPASATPIFQGATAIVENAGNGWYRCAIFTITSATVGNVTGEFRLARGTGTPSTIYDGDGTSGVYIFGAQLEPGHTFGTYFQTVSATASRQVDNAVASSLIVNPYEGTLAVEFDTQYQAPLSTSGARGIFGPVFAGLGGWGLYTTGGKTNITVNDGVLSGSFSSTIIDHTLGTKLAASYRAADGNGWTVAAASCIIGQSSTINRSIGLPQYLGIGQWGGGNIDVMRIRRIRYWPFRVSDNKLKALTGG